MRCLDHSSDSSSTRGVCASCLRDRLFSAIAAQALHHPRLPPSHSPYSDSDPPPLLFPRSVSPYVSRRNSDCASSATDFYARCDDRRRRYNLFYSTPQLGPNHRPTSTFVTTGSRDRKQRSISSFWSRLFKFRSDKLESNSNDFSEDLYQPTSTSSSNSSWLSSVFSGRRNNKLKQNFSHGPSAARVDRRPGRTVDRGMSPARTADSEDDCEDLCDHRSPTASGYSSESSQKWRQSPAVPQGLARKVRPSAPNRNIPGLVFCLSPLVRANPNQNWSQKGLPPETTFSGEIRNPGKPHISTAASFCGNRSRKIADFGRVNPNR